MKIIPLKVPDGVSGVWRVESFTVTEEKAKFSNLRAMLGHSLESVDAGQYKRLTRNGQVIMSNTRMEVRTNWPIISQATGDVLINGLGLGMVLAYILEKPTVRSVLIVENSPDVIKLVGPTYAKDSRVTIMEADAYAFNPSKGQRFNAVWHDIWDEICSDNLPQMTRLKRKYARRCDWQGCWSQSECLESRRRSRSYY